LDTRHFSSRWFFFEAGRGISMINVNSEPGALTPTSIEIAESVRAAAGTVILTNDGVSFRDTVKVSRKYQTIPSIEPGHPPMPSDHIPWEVGESRVGGGGVHPTRL
jgi:hypothetical protein